eukprot:tig00021435_g21425.t1
MGDDELFFEADGLGPSVADVAAAVKSRKQSMNELKELIEGVGGVKLIDIELPPSRDSPAHVRLPRQEQPANAKNMFSLDEIQHDMEHAAEDADCLTLYDSSVHHLQHTVIHSNGHLGHHGHRELDKTLQIAPTTVVRERYMSIGLGEIHGKAQKVIPSPPASLTPAECLRRRSDFVKSPEIAPVEEAPRMKRAVSTLCLAAYDQEDEQPSSRAPEPSPAAVQPPKRTMLEDFEILKVLGRGSFAKVLLVRKRDTKELYAMKVIRKDAVVKSRQIRGTVTERAILSDVQHPFIVKLHYAFQTNGKLYLILDFLVGGELFFHLKREKFFPEPVAQYYAAEICLALGHLHKLGIVYRDLKPENVLLDAEGHARLTDFGLAKEVDEANGGTQTFCGTLEYMAPCVLIRRGYGKNIDWWSFGCLVYEMLTGFPPFARKTRAEVQEAILHEEPRFPGYLSEEAKSLCRALLVKEPEKRLGSGPGGAYDIMMHPFFANVDWLALIQKELETPFRPDTRLYGDVTSMFDNEFTAMPPTDSPAHSLSGSVDEHFQGYSFEKENPIEQVEQMRGEQADPAADGFWYC